MRPRSSSSLLGSFPTLCAALASVCWLPAASAQTPLFSDDIHRVVPTDDPPSWTTACADFDGDGDVDVLTRKHLLLNDGCAVFVAAPCDYPQEPFGGIAAIADVDLDLDLDVAVGSRLWLNDGTGCFTDASAQIPPPSAPAPHYPAGGAFGDIDGDGDVDYVLGFAGTDCIDHFECTDGFQVLYLNDGAGGFSEAPGRIDASAFGDTSCVALGDVDRDGDLDLYVGNSGNQGHSVPSAMLLNDGHGTFVAVPPTHAPLGQADQTARPYLDDLDGDGDLDLVVATGPWWNLGEGRFIYGGLGMPDAPDNGLLHAVGDVDADGDADLVQTHWGAGYQLLVNNGHGVFDVAATAFTPSPGNEWVELADLDGDDDLDAVIAGSELEIHLHEPTDRFRWLAPVLASRGAYAASHAIGDVDGDSDLDVLEAGVGQEQLLLNDGSGTFEDATRLVPPENEWTHAATFADVDGDRDLDVFLCNRPNEFNPGLSVLWMNDGLGRFTAEPRRWTPPAKSALQALAGDIDGDGDVDVVAIGGSKRPTRVYVNDGDGWFTYAPDQSPQSSWLGHTFAALADFDGDHDLDVVSAWIGLALFVNDGSGSFAANSPTMFSSYVVRCGDAADVDADGDVDLVLATNGGTRVVLNDGHGNFALATTLLPSESIETLDAGDVDGDGDTDLLLSRLDTVADKLRLLLNDGDASFSDGTALLPPIDEHTNRISLEDLDDDGDTDLVLSHWSERSRILVNVTRQLARHAPPRVGAPLEFDLWGAPKQAFALFGATQAKRTEFGALGVLQLDPKSVFTTIHGELDANGRARVAVAIPPELSLVGATLHWQALLHSPARLTNLENTRLEAACR